MILEVDDTKLISAHITNAGLKASDLGHSHTFCVLILLKLCSNSFSICCSSSIEHESKHSPNSFLQYPNLRSSETISGTVIIRNMI